MLYGKVEWSLQYEIASSYGWRTFPTSVNATGHLRSKNPSQKTDEGPKNNNNKRRYRCGIQFLCNYCRASMISVVYNCVLFWLKNFSFFRWSQRSSSQQYSNLKTDCPANNDDDNENTSYLHCRIPFLSRYCRARKTSAVWNCVLFWLKTATFYIFASGPFFQIFR